MGGPREEDREGGAANVDDGLSIVSIVSFVELIDTQTSKPLPERPRQPPRRPTAPLWRPAAPPSRDASMPAGRPPAKRSTEPLVTGQPETPSIVDRARGASDNARGRDERMERMLVPALSSDPERAALLLLELGESAERRWGDSAAAEDYYRRALSIDAGLRAANWALRRLMYAQGRWSECQSLIDNEQLQKVEDAYRAELVFERAMLSTAFGPHDPGRVKALQTVLGLSPDHSGALVAMRRELAAVADGRSLARIVYKLAQTCDEPARGIGLYIEAARLALHSDDTSLAREACDDAHRFVHGALPSMYQALANVRLRVTDSDPRAEDLAALERVTERLQSIPPPRLAALLRRQARLLRRTSPEQAWELLKTAMSIVPSDSILHADAVALAVGLGRYKEVLSLVTEWRSLASEAERCDQISIWSAQAHATEDQRFVIRSLLASVSSAAPGFILLTAAAESRGLEDVEHTPALAIAYVEAAHAAARGTWMGPGRTPRPDPHAALSWTLQAVEILAYHVASPAALSQARDLLQQAEQTDPESALVAEAAIDIDEAHGRAAHAINRVLATNGGAPRVLDLERAATIATTHELDDKLVEIELQLIAAEPQQTRHLWRHAATLRRLADDDRHRDVLANIIECEPHSDARCMALVEGLLLALRTGASDFARSCAGQLAEAMPDDSVVRDVYFELLRGDERWDVLARALESLLTRTVPAGDLARHLRELAWIREIRQTNPAAAADVYTQWLEAIPEDRTALEGLARCRATLRDPQREAAVRVSIAEIDGSSDALWLLARSHERSGKAELALQSYQRLLPKDEWTVAVANAALAVGDLAAAAGDIAARTEATHALAAHTTDTAFGVALHEGTGWYRLLGLHDSEGALASFDRVPGAGGHVGIALTGGGSASKRSAAFAELANALEPARVRCELLLRASAFARAAGDDARAFALLEEAYATCPESDDALCRLVDEPIPAELLADPFGGDRFTNLAHALERRAQLASTEQRTAWQLELAEMLERAGDIAAGARIATEIVAAAPQHRGALGVLRRLAQHAKDEELEAQACWALAQTFTDTSNQLSWLRAAARIFEGTGPGNHVGYAITAYRRIALLDATAPELDRLLLLLRQASSNAGLYAVLEEQLEHLALNRENDRRLVSLLVVRADLLAADDRTDDAVADLQTAMAYSVDPTAVRRRLDRLQGMARTAPRPVAIPVRDTDESPAVDPNTVTAHSEITEAEPLVDSLDASTVTRDPFGATTALVDVSELQREEREIARHTSSRPVVETTTEGAHLGDTFSTDPGNTASDSSTAADLPSNVHAPIAHEVSLADVTESRRPRKLADAGAFIELVPSLQLRPIKSSTLTHEPVSDDSAAVMIPVDALTHGRVVDEREELDACQRELQVAPDASRALLHCEAGRIAARIGDRSLASEHFTSALALPADDVKAVALRALRRLALERGDLRESARLLALEESTFSSRERDVATRHRLDLLLALGAPGEAADIVEAASDTKHELTDQLAVLDAALAAHDSTRAARALEGLLEKAPAALQDSLRFARGVIALQVRDMTQADRWFSLSSDPRLSTLRLEAIRHTALQGEAELAGAALLELAHHVERDDPVMAAALALRAQSWVTPGKSEASKQAVANAGELALRATPRDPLVCRAVAEHALANEVSEVASHAFVRWMRSGSSSPAERAYAAARAAELAPERLGRLWAQLLSLDGPDDYAAARLHSVLAATDLDAALEHDLATAASTGRCAPLLRAAFQLRARGEVARAISVLEGADRGSLLVIMALAELQADAGDHASCAQLLAQTAPTQPAPIAAWLCVRAAEARSAHARQVRTPAESAPLHQTAFEAWGAVLQDDPSSPRGHSQYMHHANELGDPALYGRALARVRAVAPSQAAATSLALRHARSLAKHQPKLAINVARAAARGADDPRATALTIYLAAAHRDGETQTLAFEDRIQVLADLGMHDGIEPVQLRLRAAHRYLERGDLERARAQLELVEAALPGTELVEELLDLVLSRSGHEVPLRLGGGFVRLLRAAERALEHGQTSLAVDLYRRALLARPSPFAAEPFVRLAQQTRCHGPLRSYAESQVAAAEQAGDRLQLLEALDLVASACDAPLGDDISRAALERLYALDPARADVGARLEHAYISAGELTSLPELRQRLDDRTCAATVDSAVLAMSRGEPLSAIADAVAASLDDRCSLFALRLADAGGGGSPATTVAIAERTASRLGNAHATAAFLARAANVLADTGDPAGAVVRAIAALDACPSYPVLEVARQCALATGNWPELVRICQREAEASSSRREAARHHHFAAVTAMDKVRDRAAALDALRATLELDPRNMDALVRVRLLVIEGELDGFLFDTVRAALREERTPAVRVELHRMLAELERASGHRDRAMSEYRSMLAIDPTDARAHAALVDLASDNAADEDALAAIDVRLQVERDSVVLAGLHRRRAALLAPTDPKAAIAALQRAVQYRSDEQTLTMLIDVALADRDLATAASACEQLFVLPLAPQQRAVHLLRVAKVFMASGASGRADEILDVAFELSPSLHDAVHAALQLGGVDSPERMRSRIAGIARIARDRIESDVRDADACKALIASHRELALREPAVPAHRRIVKFAGELLALHGTEPAPDDPPLVIAPSVLANPAFDRAVMANLSAAELCASLRDAAATRGAPVDVDLSRYGVTSRDRLRGNNPVVAIVKEIAKSLGLEDVVVYVSERHDHAMIVEPTPAVSLVLGHAIARGEPADVRFAAGACLKLAHLGLAHPARMSVGELTATLANLGETSTTTQAMDLARDLKLIGITAGLVACGSLARTLSLLAGAIRTPIDNVLAEPFTGRLLRFALSETPFLHW